MVITPVRVTGIFWLFPMKANDFKGDTCST